MRKFFAFRCDLAGFFVRRPNRFVVEVQTELGLVAAHCPNPGRISELLLPGARVGLEKAPDGRKLPYTLVSVQDPWSDKDHIVPLASARANQAIQVLVLPRLFPNAVQIRPEFTLGRSRFDFLVIDSAGSKHLVEVKACSEVFGSSALFPDAPSTRAVKHLEELVEQSHNGYQSHVIFAVVHGDPDFFSPNGHTDPMFSRALAEGSPSLNLHACLLRSEADGQTEWVRDIPIRLPPVDDSGFLLSLGRVDPAEWTLSLNYYASGWEKALRRNPARTTWGFSRKPENEKDLLDDFPPGPTEKDPRLDPEFQRSVVKWRHAAADASW